MQLKKGNQSCRTRSFDQNSKPRVKIVFTLTSTILYEKLYYFQMVVLDSIMKCSEAMIVFV